jgi:hypothetical protein
VRSQSHLRRQIELRTATALVVGEVIAVGIFPTPADLVKSLGSQDNWPIHFESQVVEAAAKAGVEMVRLPTHAPWLNPIEKLWRKLKQELNLLPISQSEVMR